MNEGSGTDEAEEKRPGIRLLRSWLNKNIKVDLSFLAHNPKIVLLKLLLPLKITYRHYNFGLIIFKPLFL